MHRIMSCAAPHKPLAGQPKNMALTIESLTLHCARRRYDKKLEPVLRARRRVGRHMPVMNVIPPGLDFSNLKARFLPAPYTLGYRFSSIVCRL